MNTMNPLTDACPPSAVPQIVGAPELIAFDMDGTLLDSAKQVLPGSVRALEALRSHGTRVMLASGRPLPGLRRLAEQLPLGEDLVFAALNGSVVVDQSSGETLSRDLLPEETTHALIACGAEHGMLMMLPVDDELIVSDASAAQSRHEAEGNGLRLREPADFLHPDVPTTKVLFCAEREQLEVLAQQLREQFAGSIELAFSSAIYLEATAAGVDKSAALLSYCRRTGIDPQRTVAFGDNGNDVTMLRAAGLGVAMGNAVAEAREAADEVTATNDQEGIARVLSRWVDVGDLD